MKTIEIGKLNVSYTEISQYKSFTYLLMPIELSEGHIAKWCNQCKSNVAIISNIDWDNDLTPWPAPGVPKGSPDFKGLAAQFLQTLTMEVVPRVEQGLAVTSRNLIGVSLSGLFALWAWLQDDTFANICSLSGSFWYEGFVGWLDRSNIPYKTGDAYFELGVLEPESSNHIFATVGDCTVSVIERLKLCGIKAELQWVPGTHYSPIQPRLDLAFAHLATVPVLA